MVPNAVLEPTEIKVYAANDTEIPVLGGMRLGFTVKGQFLTADLLVSDFVDEILLGIDWLTQNECQWDFVRKEVKIAGQTVPLKSRPSRATVRRVWVEENVCVQPGTQANVPVKMTLSNWRTPAADWVVETKKWRPGVFVARTLLSNDTQCAAVRVVNVSAHPFKLAEGRLVGEAKMVVDAGCGPGLALSAGQMRRTDMQGTGSATVSTAASPTPEQLSTRGDVEHLKPVIDALPPELSVTQREAAVKFIHDNAQVFSKGEFDIGRTSIIPHRIDVQGHRPFRQPLRRHPRVHEQFIDEQVEKMLRHDIIEPAASPWASNVVLAKKADGSLRFCVDYRQLNELTYKDSHPLPRISSCIEALGGAEFLSTIDMSSGFWQTSMHPEDADKTAFITRKGQYRFKVLSFGLANAPSLFQRIMNLVMAGLTWECCLVYVDDIIVFGATFDEHAARLEQVFQRLAAAGLKLKPSKCRLFQKRVVFLGHVVSKNGVEPDQSKISAVVDWPVPRDVSETRMFVGLASYYRFFVPHFSSIAAPLFDLTKKGVPFVWSEKMPRSV